MNTYSLTHTSNCPHNNEVNDLYTVTIRSEKTIMVEHILNALREAPGWIYQEDLATRLRDVLGASVTVEGWHHGVHVVSTRE